MANGKAAEALRAAEVIDALTGDPEAQLRVISEVSAIHVHAFHAIQTEEGQLEALPKMDLEFKAELIRKKRSLVSYLLLNARSEAVIEAVLNYKPSSVEGRVAYVTPAKDFRQILHIEDIHTAGLDTHYQILRRGLYQFVMYSYLKQEKPKHLFLEDLDFDVLAGAPERDRLFRRRLTLFGRLSVEKVRKAFSDNVAIENLSVEQRTLLGKVGAGLVYAIANPDVNVYKTLTPEESKRMLEMLRKAPERECFKFALSEREKWLRREVLSRFAKDSVEQAAVIYGAMHRPYDSPEWDKNVGIRFIGWPTLLDSILWDPDFYGPDALKAMKDRPEVQRMILEKMKYLHPSLLGYLATEELQWLAANNLSLSFEDSKYARFKTTIEKCRFSHDRKQEVLQRYFKASWADKADYTTITP